MEPWVQMMLTIIGSVVASSGFWAFMHNFVDKKSAQSEMLIGLSHDRIIYLGLAYIKRGAITHEEYENLHDYLYKPYLRLGGNGSASKVMKEVDDLPIVDISQIYEER